MSYLRDLIMPTSHGCKTHVYSPEMNLKSVPLFLKMSRTVPLSWQAKPSSMIRSDHNRLHMASKPFESITLYICRPFKLLTGSSRTHSLRDYFSNVFNSFMWLSSKIQKQRELCSIFCCREASWESSVFTYCAANGNCFISFLLYSRFGFRFKNGTQSMLRNMICATCLYLFSEFKLLHQVVYKFFTYLYESVTRLLSRSLSHATAQIPSFQKGYTQRTSFFSDCSLKFGHYDRDLAIIADIATELSECLCSIIQ